jgi:hypothetical protein
MSYRKIARAPIARSVECSRRTIFFKSSRFHSSIDRRQQPLPITPSVHRVAVEIVSRLQIGE